jgi:hypothetical protein
MVRMRRAFGDLVISVGALIALLMMLAAFNPGLRQELSSRLGSEGAATAQVADAESAARGIVSVVIIAVREQSIAHAPLTAFTVAGVVLLLFMLRT